MTTYPYDIGLVTLLQTLRCIQNRRVPTIPDQEITMFNMFKQLFAAITLFFVATEKLASASNHLATWADESAASFSDEARIERQKKLAKLKADLKAVEKQSA